MTAIPDLAERLRAASGPDRGIDHAVAYHVDGIGTDLERALYAEKGDAAFIPDQHGLTPMDYKNGDFVRQEWVKGTRRNPGSYKPRIWLNCNGPRPLRSCAAYTASLDAAIALVERVRPGCRYVLSGGDGGWSATLQWVGADGKVRGTRTGDDDYETGALALLSALIASLVDGEG